MWVIVGDAVADVVDVAVVVAVADVVVVVAVGVVCGGDGVLLCDGVLVGVF